MTEKAGIAFWGDSMVDTLGPVGNSVVNFLRRKTLRRIDELGTGGETGAATGVRLTSDPGRKHLTHIIYTGGNSYITGGTTYVSTGVADNKAAIQSMVSYIGHTRYIILGNVAGVDGGSNPISVQVRRDKAEFTAWVLATFGTRGGNPLLWLQDLDPSDRICRADMRMPVSVAQDDSHPNAVGNEGIADNLLVMLNTLGL